MTQSEFEQITNGAAGKTIKMINILDVVSSQKHSLLKKGYTEQPDGTIRMDTLIDSDEFAEELNLCALSDSVEITEKVITARDGGDITIFEILEGN